MNSTDLLALLPLIVMAVAPVLVMVVAAFRRSHRVSLVLSLLGYTLGFIALFVAIPYIPRQITPLVIVDRYGLFYMGLLFATGFAVSLLSYGYMESFDGAKDEYYVLVLLATFGSSVLVVSNHFATFFLGLEILSVSLYAMVSYTQLPRRRIEAAMKYLILAGASAAFLLFGMALIYSIAGTMNFTQMATTDVLQVGASPVLFTGIGLLFVGIGFKLALVPFHLWTPDVYQGAPSPVTAFIATVSKGGMFALTLRYFNDISFHTNTTVWWMFAVIAIASMLIGNILAVMQNNVKRILAYSSIAHLGYLTVAFLASGPIAPRAVSFYLVSYFLTTVCAFGVITLLSNVEHETEEINDYTGLFWRHPWLATIFTLSLFSLGGIPPTSGIIGKIYIAAAGVSSSLWLLLFVLVFGSIIGIFYYLRIVIAMFRQDVPEEEVPALTLSPYMSGRAVLTVLAVFILGLGVYPGLLMQLIDKMITGL